MLHLEYKAHTLSGWLTISVALHAISSLIMRIFRAVAVVLSTTWCGWRSTRYVGSVGSEKTIKVSNVWAQGGSNAIMANHRRLGTATFYEWEDSENDDVDVARHHLSFVFSQNQRIMSEDDDSLCVHEAKRPKDVEYTQPMRRLRGQKSRLLENVRVTGTKGDSSMIMGESTVDRGLAGSSDLKSSNQESDLLAKVVVVISSAILLTSLLLCMVELRDCCKHKECPTQERGPTDSKRYASISKNATSSTHETGVDPTHPPIWSSPILPHLTAECDHMINMALRYPAEECISRVSTMTNSFAEPFDIPLEDPRVVVGKLETVTELSASDRVSDRTELTSILENVTKTLISTNPDADPVDLRSRVFVLLPGDCLGDDRKIRTSLICGTPVRYSEDEGYIVHTSSYKKTLTMSSPGSRRDRIVPLESRGDVEEGYETEARGDVEEGYETDCDEERIIQPMTEICLRDHSVSINCKKRSHVIFETDDGATDYIRYVYIVPVASDQRLEGILGMTFDDATCELIHPTVAKVDASSPLQGRVFDGDILLCVDDVDLAGYRKSAIVDLMRRPHCSKSQVQGVEVEARAVKLTIMSSHVGQCRDFDSPLQETGIEL